MKEFETGFYYKKYESDIIYEIKKNTDKTWLKEEPEVKYLVDTWELVSKVGQQAKYETYGNLIPLKDFDITNLVPITYKSREYIGKMGLILIVSE